MGTLERLALVAGIAATSFGCQTASSGAAPAASTQSSEAAATTQPSVAAPAASSVPSVGASAGKPHPHLHHPHDAGAAASAASAAPAASAPVSPMDAPIAYEAYVNTADCYKVDIPKGMVVASQTDAGQSWKSTDGSVEIHVYAVAAQDAPDIESSFADDSKDDPSHQRKVTLKVLEKTFYVVSGFEGANIFYDKVMYPGFQIVFEVSYPAGVKEWWNRATDHMSKSLESTCAP